MADEFSRFHPLVNLIFYAAVLGITMFQMQAGLILISLVCSGIYHFMLKGTSGVKYAVMLIGVFVFSACINPLFSHKGGTLLFYLFTGNPVTLESIVYGIATATILCAVLLWFSSFNVVITEDKLTAGIGKFLPHTAMLITMIMRFVPKVTRQGRAVIAAQKALNSQNGRNVLNARSAQNSRSAQNARNSQNARSKNSLYSRLKKQADVFSITTTWALENSVDTADSMRARGYGSGKRTSYNNYKFERRDRCALIWISVLAVCVCAGLAGENVKTYYYPLIRIKHDMVVYIMHILLCMTPVLINVLESLRWYRLRSKI